MSSAITNAGENLIALHQNQETGLVIDTFILANVDGLDAAAAVDRTEGMPNVGDIVYSYPIPEENRGYINPNQVVYSMLLTSDIGDFDFNWIGLYSSEDDAVVAITYCPTLSKWKTAHPTMGNALTRNFMLEYSGIQDVTQINVNADTWQIDFTARMKGIDERERLSNFDIYGGACFFDDGFLVIDDAGTFKLQLGLGYVEGIRIVQAASQELAPTLPAEVFLDVALQPQGSDRVAVVQVVYTDPGDYVDGTNDNHYGQKIAEIAADRTVTDFRPMTPDGELGNVYAVKDHDHTTDEVVDLLSDPHEFAKGQRYAQTLLRITAGAVVWDCEANPSAVLLLDTDVTSFTISNYKPGGSYDLTVVQDATGGWACATPAVILWADETAYEGTADPLAIDRIYIAPFTAPNDATVKPLASVEYNFKAVA
ncbi:phage tail protein [Pseudodesulfovibrio sediminis]|uniref:Phage tail fibre protein N-terminal domain-containing protein n=1 Tax=Pseudodesulfovibrio sediminis TaxID=2810563 RepID=A0ABN6EXI1_9BACT|nr:phage tail protein [Pseudodesulfovibrio sediminis]BCS89959.1 hypothetical protein PSDVSF_32010 [Pseudodesulfovibrio sediminis]